MTSGAGRTLTWNGDNRLASVTGGTSLAFTYDADGARIQQVEGAITRRYLGDDYEVQVGGSISKYISVARHAGRARGRADDLLGPHRSRRLDPGRDRRLGRRGPSQEVPPVRRDPVDDRARSATSRAATSASVRTRRACCILHARYYDPALGRFISPDPTIDGTDTVGLNRYAYCGNNPINNKDVDGLKKDPISRTKSAADKNKEFAEEEPTIGEPGKDKVRYTFYQKPVAEIGSHFKAIVTNEAGERVGVYSLNGFLKKYNNTDPSTDGYKQAGTIYKDQATVKDFNKAYMNVANGGVYDLGDSNAAMHKAIQAIGEPKGLFTVSNPISAPVAAYGFDNAD